MSLPDLNKIKNSQGRIVGLKQTLRALQLDQIVEVYLANDLEEHILRKITESCREKKVPLTTLNYDQKTLGGICQIEVGAAVVALLKNN